VPLRHQRRSARRAHAPLALRVSLFLIRWLSSNTTRNHLIWSTNVFIEIFLNCSYAYLQKWARHIGGILGILLAEDRVACEDNVKVGEPLFGALALGAVVETDGEGARFGLVCDFFHPLVQNGHRPDDECLLAILICRFVMADQPDRLHSLAEAHLVCQQPSPKLGVVFLRNKPV